MVFTDVLDEAGEARRELRAAGLEVRYRRLDVTAAADWDRAVEFAEAEFGPLDVLVNNAGIVTFSGVADTPDDEWHRAVGVNQTGVFFGMRAAVPSMVRAGAGSIINVSSVFGMTGVPGYFAYQASKGAVVQMTRAAAVDLADRQDQGQLRLPGTDLHRHDQDRAGGDGRREHSHDAAAARRPTGGSRPQRALPRLR